MNRIVAYEIYKKEIQIHIFPAIENNPFELKALVIDGFRQIAQKIKTSADFEEIDKIVGASWIVNEHPSLIKSLGFDIPPGQEDIYYAAAEISKNRFLELYG